MTQELHAPPPHDDVTLHGPHIAIPREEKKSRLARMSENDFRDRIVRPVFLARNCRDGRDFHGPDEDGKDVVFIEDDKFGQPRVICVQTKKGNLTMASDASANIETAVTQMRVALNTQISLLESREKRYPDEVYLCASGKINKRAIEHIVSELARERGIRFLDAESLIDIIDKHCPQVWHGISVEVFAHYDSIRKHVEHSASDIIAPSAASDNTFVQLTFYRPKPRRVKRHHRVSDELGFEELRVHDLISQNMVLVVGDAGSGKSTALWRVAYEIVQRDRGKGDRIPAIVSARDLNIAQPTVTDLVNKVKLLSAQFSQVSDLFSTDDLHSGRIALLVDGLDEVTDISRRRTLCDALDRFSSRYPKCPLIMTTRPDSETETRLENRANVYRIAPVSWNQINKIVKHGLSNRRLKKNQMDTIAKGAQRVLRQIEEVHGFQLTPLLATVYAASAEFSRSDVPANVTEVFKKYSELMLGRWDERKGLGQQVQAQIKDYLLRKVAYQMHREQRLYVSAAEFGNEVTRLLGELGHQLDVQEIIDELLNRSRLMRTNGKVVRFSHLLLQEFFAGRAIADADVMRYVGDRWWTKAIVFYYGEHADRADHLRQVQISMRKKPTPTAYRTIGLALQASYLSSVEIKKDVWLDLIYGLSKFMVEAIRGIDDNTLFPMLPITFSYLELRDAVPFASLGNDDIRRQAMEGIDSAQPTGDNEARRFWYVTALLESGLVDRAYEFLGDFRFRETRYYLWIFMGALFIEKILPMSRGQKNTAHKICEQCYRLAGPAIREVSREFRTLLLEERAGRIVDVGGRDDGK